jgi:DNA-directed RNA polymerase specialized sigma24 family protein
VPSERIPDGAVDQHRNELDTEIVAALAALPPKQLQAIVYHHLAGLPYAEVAAIIGGTAGAARRAAADGIAAIRRRREQGALDDDRT